MSKVLLVLFPRNTDWLIMNFLRIYSIGYLLFESKNPSCKSRTRTVSSAISIFDQYQNQRLFFPQALFLSFAPKQNRYNVVCRQKILLRYQQLLSGALYIVLLVFLHTLALGYAATEVCVNIIMNNKPFSHKINYKPVEESTYKSE